MITGCVQVKEAGERYGSFDAKGNERELVKTKLMNQVIEYYATPSHEFSLPTIDRLWMDVDGVEFEVGGKELLDFTKDLEAEMREAIRRWSYDDGPLRYDSYV